MAHYDAGVAVDHQTKYCIIEGFHFNKYKNFKIFHRIVNALVWTIKREQSFAATKTVGNVRLSRIKCRDVHDFRGLLSRIVMDNTS